MRVPRGSLLVPVLVLGLLAACTPPEDLPEPRHAPRGVTRPAPLLEPPPIAPLVPVETCRDTAEGFDDWVAAFEQHAVAKGITRDVAASALADVAYDPKVIELDRTQRPHKATFEQFSASHVTRARVDRGRRMLAKHADLLGRVGAKYPVPKEIVVALWGLETDYGASQGTTRSLDALATLAYDCRRAERFRGELLSALTILQRGDLPASAMVGAWAGELGQTQFLPSSYAQYGVDFDGDGRVDLVHSVDDALGSTAAYLAGHGWRAGEGYAPGTPNYDVLAEWNKSEVYRRTIVLFATRLAGRR